jgi:phosphoribosyl-AMP cyclohydrolase
VVQEAATGEVLMVAYMNAEALAKTLATGEAHYYSRSRGCPGLSQPPDFLYFLYFL